MADLFIFIALISLIAFIIGLIKPKLVLMPNRIRSSIVFFVIFCIMLPLGAELSPDNKKSESASSQTTKEVKSTTKTQAVQAPTVTKETEKIKEIPFEYKNLTLKDYKNETQKKRLEIVKNYIESKHLTTTEIPLFYNCMSQISYTKAPDLTIGDTLGWCYADFSRDNTALNNRINLDTFVGNFSGWDGSYRPLEKLIKASMNDDSSYKHSATTYRLFLNETPAYAIVNTVFKGTNSYGGVVKDNVKVKVDINSGDIIEVISE